MLLIFCEIVGAEHAEREATRACPRAAAYMLDQSHNVEARIPAIIRSVLNVHSALAKALLVVRRALSERQRACDVIGANAVLVEGYETDVRLLLAHVSEQLGCPSPADPFGGFLASGYLEQIAEARKQGVAAGWNC